jgi:hypothetical protein
MPKTIQQVADEVRAALPPLPEGFYVRPADGDNIIVGNDDLAFALTRRQIDDNIHMTPATSTFPLLLEALKAQERGETLVFPARNFVR